MCFSAEVSFGASAIISTVGIISFKKAERTPLRLLAMIPIFFGIQQFSEGVLWLASEYEKFAGFEIISTYAFIFFAWIIWPLYLPFCLWKLESNPRRKRMLLSLSILGFSVAAALSYIIVFRGIHARIEDFSIVYEFNAPDSQFAWMYGIIYASSVVVPTIVSSVKNMWWLGITNVGLYLFSRLYFGDRVISVWCFFAAITSIMILWIIIKEKEKRRKDKSKIHFT